jgi:DNA repair protein RadA/Sms
MTKVRTTYVCQSCAFETARWAGKCPNCGAWNSFVEEVNTPATAPKRGVGSSPRNVSAPIPLNRVEPASEGRLPTGMKEFDRVLGGGIVPGSLVLIGGDPGIGKSTLMMHMAASVTGQVVLYITGEESAAQIRMRSERLNIVPSDQLLLLAETNIDLIDAVIEKNPPDVLIVDSIQTIYRPDMESAPGTVSQVRESTARFMRIAKGKGIPVFLVVHVTKEGAIAGPKVVEHMVDAVIQFEGERHHAYRILRAMKNRFGSTNEIGIFEMHDGGLREVTNPSEVFLSERRSGSSGTVVVASMEGTRPLLVEVQALVAPTSYGVPQRTATGFDTRRLQMLLAVLEKRSGFRVGQYDVFVNVAGGVRLDEPAADLGMALAIVSSLRDTPIDASVIVAGEIGLGGEIRTVHQVERRIVEAAKLGFTLAVIPQGNLKSIRPPQGMRVQEVETIDQAIMALLPDRGREITRENLLA